MERSLRPMALQPRRAPGSRLLSRVDLPRLKRTSDAPVIAFSHFLPPADSCFTWRHSERAPRRWFAPRAAGSSSARSRDTRAR